MSELEREIRQMFEDISEYDGDFGDGVEAGSYDPFTLIRSTNLSPFERRGVSVALLVWLATAIDNSTFQDAQKSYRHLLQPVLAEGLLEDQPLVLEAAKAFLESEESFVRRLAGVYEGVVKVAGNVA